MKCREPAVAGRFYSSVSEELSQQMDKYFSVQPELSVVPKAVIVPHAGYFYSGEVAAYAYRLISKIANQIHRVVLLGPSHRVALEGCAVPDSDRFVTPLGEVVIDRENISLMLSKNLVIESEKVHHWEHSLEVQLPFLQYCLHNFVLLPIVVGPSNPKVISQILDLVAKQPDTLIVVSSDLSHYHPYTEAKEIDANTIEDVLMFKTDISPEQACGCHATNGLLDYAKHQHWQIQCVNHTNSGEVIARQEHRTPFNSEQVVGYASFVLY